VQWPRRCACCSKPPETTARAVDEARSVAEYPISRPCFRHAKVDEVALFVSLAIGAAVVLGGWVAAFGFSIMRWVLLQGILMLIAWMLVTGALYWLLGLFVGHKRSSCADSSWPVAAYHPPGFGQTLGKDGERTDERELRLWCEEAAGRVGSGSYGLELRSNRYARELIALNGGDPKRIDSIAEAM
jgi:hypothetical protein